MDTSQAKCRFWVLSKLKGIKRSFVDLPKYKKQLRIYYNIHKGDSCIVTGCGPSLSSIPAIVFKKFKILGVNASHKKVTPDYMTIIDTQFSWIRDARIFAYKSKTPLFVSWNWDNGEERKTKLHNEIIMPTNNFPVDYSVKNQAYREHMLCLFNDPIQLEAGVTSILSVVPEAAIPLALYMGFEKIYLAGVDFSTTITSGRHFYKDTGDDERRIADEHDRLGNNHFSDKLFIFNLLAQSQNAYKIFNLNFNSAVCQFPFVEWKSLI